MKMNIDDSKIWGVRNLEKTEAGGGENIYLCVDDDWSY